MYIRSLTIKNYRNFGDPPFTINLKPFTLILGENNIGKTNLLNAISLIFSQEITIFRQRILEIDDINYTSVSIFKKMVSDFSIPAADVRFPDVRIDVILADLSDQQLAAAGDWPAPNDKDLKEAVISYQFALRSSFDKSEWINLQRTSLEEKKPEERVNLVNLPIGEYRYSIFGSNDPSNKCDLHFLNMFKMELLDALRDAKNELIASGNNRLLFKILNRKDDAQYDDIKTSLGELNAIIDKNPNLAGIIADVEKLLDRVSLQIEASDNSVRFRFSSPETTEVLKKLSLQYGVNPVDVARNGLGRNNLLYISLILSHLSANDNHNNEVVFRLIAIEEPEAHLHPHLQDHIAENIESIQSEFCETMQLIITSHSTHIAAKLNLENTVIVFFDNQAKCLNSHYILSKIDKVKEKASIQYLSKYLDATKSRMFFARKLILVEGISEQILIPLFFRHHFGYSLEKIGCNILNVNGVAFKHFLEIVRGGYFIKCLVLTDSDSDTQTAQRAEDLKSEYEKLPLIYVNISSQTTFEKDLIASNKISKGKEILERALITTRPIAGEKFVSDNKDKEIDIELFFSLIENHKSEFSFNLLQEILCDGDGFTIPEYIKQGFESIK